MQKKKTIPKNTLKRENIFIPKHKKCVKCGGTEFDDGIIKIGQVFAPESLGYRSDRHYPYADHVSLQKAIVCLKCGFVEIYFNTDDLKRKVVKNV